MKTRRTAAITFVVSFAITLAALLASHYITSAREASEVPHCRGNMQLIAVGCAGYEEDSGTSLYDAADSAQELVDLLVDLGHLTPSSPNRYGCGDEYEYEWLYDNPVTPSSKPWEDHPVLRCPEENAHPSIGRNVLYPNGHVKHSVKVQP